MKTNFTLLLIVLLLNALPVFSQQLTSSTTGSWKLTGNAGTDVTINFIGTKDNKSLVFRTNNIERMRILKTGFVGIGTSIPSTRLNVDSGSYVSLGGGGFVVVGSATDYNIAFDPSNIQARYKGNTANLSLNQYGGTTYVGNSTASSTALSVKGIDYGIYSLAKADNAYAVYGLANGVDAFGVAGYANNWTGIYGFSGNYVGVYGETTDQYGWAGYFAGNVATTGVYQTSDANLKQNIRDVSNAMTIINQLHPKFYTFRQDDKYKTLHLPLGEHYGLLAQDVEKVLPNLVKNSSINVIKPVLIKRRSETDTNSAITATEIRNTGEKINFESLNYTELIPILVKGMQEQQQQIQRQQSVIEKQDQRITQLEQLVQKIPGSAIANTDFTNGAYLKQNTPNPFTQNTVISCFVPDNLHRAQLMISAINGAQLQTFTLSNKGINNVTINGGTLAAGQYKYTLLIDGKVADGKIMTLTK